VVGERSSGTAEWTFSGETPFSEFGETTTTGDLDGDGAIDLVIGETNQIGGTGPGSVYVFLSPEPGPHTGADADHVLQSGLGIVDWFGASLDAGDLDGDGRDDLVVGAPLDSTIDWFSGSVLVLYGGGF
jgi:hypothetical protein